MTLDEHDAELWREVFKRRLDAFEKKLEENSATTAEIHANTKHLVEMIQAWQGTAKVFGWVSRPIVWIVGLVGGVLALYTSWPRK